MISFIDTTYQKSKQTLSVSESKYWKRHPRITYSQKIKYKFDDVNDLFSPRVFSTEFRDFVDICLRKNPGERPDLVTLMSHPWLLDVEKDPTDVAKWVRDVIKLPNPQ